MNLHQFSSHCPRESVDPESIDKRALDSRVRGNDGMGRRPRERRDPESANEKALDSRVRGNDADALDSRFRRSEGLADIAENPAAYSHYFPLGDSGIL
jgi:hypothetical protein